MFTSSIRSIIDTVTESVYYLCLPGHRSAFSGSPAGVVGEGMLKHPTDPPQDDMGSTRDHLYPCTYPARLHGSSIRARVPCVSSQTATKMVRAVATLERWMWSKYGETRRIETIPPPELDAYLAEFWQGLVRENGTDFLPVSLRKYRYCLDRFLVSNDYPESITTSLAFPQSQSAYQLRVNLLMLQKRS